MNNKFFKCIKLLDLKRDEKDINNYIFTLHFNRSTDEGSRLFNFIMKFKNKLLKDIDSHNTKVHYND